MRKTPTVASGTRPVRRFVLLVGGLLVVAGAVLYWWSRPGLRVHLDAARDALSAGDAAGALAHLKTAETLAGDRAEVQYLLAVAHRRLGRVKPFELHLARAAQLGCPEEDLQRQRWLALAQLGESVAIERQLMDLIQRGATDEAAEEIYEALAMGHLASYRLQHAWQCLDHWLHWRPDAPQAHLLRAGIYEQLGDISAAVEDYRTVIESAPNRRDVRIMLAETLLLGRGGVEEALGHYQVCLASDPEDVDAILGVAQCERRLGKSADARKRLDGILQRELTPNQRVTALVELGEALLSERKGKEAAEVLAEAVELAPANLSVHLAMGRALTASGQPERAKYHAERVADIKEQDKRLKVITRRVIDSPYDAEPRYQAGEILRQRGLHQEAIGWLLSALECDPSHPQAHAILADYSAASGDENLSAQLHLLKGKGALVKGLFWQALEEFGLARRNPNTQAEAYVLSGEALYKIGQFGNAIRILDQALQLNPGDTDARRWLAASYHDIGAMDHAMAELQIVAKEAPEDPRPHRLMGLIYKDYESYPEAVAAYRESLDRDPDQPDKAQILIEMAECLVKERKHSEALETLRQSPKSGAQLALQAECYFAQGNRSEARKVASEALELQPDHLRALQLAATLDLESGDTQSAANILRQAVEHHPKDFRLRYRLGQIYQRLGETERAKEELEVMDELRALSRQFTDLHQQAIDDPSNVDVRYQLGVVARQLAKTELARTWFVATLGMDPNHQQARQALDEMLPDLPSLAPPPDSDAKLGTGASSDTDLSQNPAQAAH
jgi:tetratricopeptide (TPR) repeat protein